MHACIHAMTQHARYHAYDHGKTLNLTCMPCHGMTCTSPCMHACHSMRQHACNHACMRQHARHHACMRQHAWHYACMRQHARHAYLGCISWACSEFDTRTHARMQAAISRPVCGSVQVQTRNLMSVNMATGAHTIQGWPNGLVAAELPTSLSTRQCLQTPATRPRL